MRKIAFGCLISIVSSMAYADRFLDYYDQDGSSAPLWLLVYIPIALVALSHKESPLHDWANSQPHIALGTFFVLPIVFLFKKLLAIIVLVVIFLFLLSLFRKSGSTDDRSTDKELRSDQTENLIADSTQIDASHNLPQRTVTSPAENPLGRLISHATKMGTINFEQKEKMASESISFLTAEIDWSSVNHYRKTGGIDPELGSIVLLISTLMLFQPLMIDEDSAKCLQLSEPQKARWSAPLIITIASICSRVIVERSFVDLEFPYLDEDEMGADDYAFARDVELAARHILNRYEETKSVLDQLVRKTL